MDGLLRPRLIIIVLGYLGSGCAQSHSIDGVRLCPALTVTSEIGAVTYGGLASQGRFPADACVELFSGGERIAHTYSNGRGAFTLLFRVVNDGTGALELRVTEAHGRGAVTSEVFVMPRPSQGEIVFPEGSMPVTAHDPLRIEFNGGISRIPPGTLMRDAWIVNWTLGEVDEIEPTPGGRPFTASVLGRPGDCITVISQHEDLGAGGCWWPPGGGGCAPAHCTFDMYVRGMCVSDLTLPPCTGRGCSIIDVEERRVDVPPPVMGTDVVTVPPLESLDAGTDVLLPDAPLDVPPADVEVM